MGAFLIAETHFNGSILHVMPGVLFIASLCAWLISAIKPVDRAAWALESILLVVGLGWLFLTYKMWPLSDISYSLIFAYLVLHVVGAHYTYSRVPAGAWLGRVLGSGRNSYDRVVHLAFGLLLTYPWRETVSLSMHISPRQSSFVAILIVGTISAVYEIIEWAVALVVKPPDAINFIGAQGDFFDSQKDMACAFLGALVAVGVTEAL